MRFRARPVTMATIFALSLIAPAAVMVPDASAKTFNGVASYYGARFHGRQTANGERFNMHALTAAHKTLPFGTKLKVTNPDNGRSVVVRINDRGPYVGNRVLDLSKGAAAKIGMVQKGVGKVKMEIR